MPSRQVHLSGKLVAEEDAKISIFDSAVLLGDTVTESTRTFSHKPFKLEQHIDRLYKSLKHSAIAVWISSCWMPNMHPLVWLNSTFAYWPDVPSGYRYLFALAIHDPQISCRYSIWVLQGLSCRMLGLQLPPEPQSKRAATKTARVVLPASTGPPVLVH